MKSLIFILVFFFMFSAYGKEISLVRIRYSGGGDWYNDPEVLPNLSKEIYERTGISLEKSQKILRFNSKEIFDYPFLYLTGHGNIKLSDEEITMLKRYLSNGGFLYIDDDYGLDKYIRPLLKKIYPDKDLIPISNKNKIYSIFYDLPGLPKIHKHNGKPPQGFGIFDSGRMIIYYTYESNISDGWADPDTHNDPPAIRELSFKMGVNIFLYAIFRK